MRERKQTVIKKFSNRNLKAHKKRSLLLIAVIAALTMLITSFNIISGSVFKNMENTYLRQYGNKSHILLGDVTEKDEKRIKEYSNIKEYGESISVGNAVNKEFGKRPTQLRFGDTNYAKLAFSYPGYGNMPKEEDEVALDESVLEDLKGNAKLGDTVVIEWVGEEGIKHSNQFIIAGIWKENNLCPNRMIWVSRSFADKVNRKTEMALLFKKENKIEESYNIMSEKLKLDSISKEINWVYDSENRFSMEKETFVYRIGTILILISGFLVLYNIVQISVITDIKLYGRMMTIGAAPHQVRFALLRQMHILAMGGISTGLILGYFLGVRLVPSVVTISNSSSMTYVKAMDFVTAAVFIYLLAMFSSIKPAFMASKVNPLDLLDEENSYSFHKKSSRKSSGLPALFQLSLSYIGGFKKRNSITITLLSAGIVGVSCVYVINNSFDIDKYKREAAISDFTISEKTLGSAWGDYDTEGTTISKNVLDMINGLEGIQEKGALYSQDVSTKLSKKAYKNIVDYYEQNDGEILKYMGDNSAWNKGYQKMKDTTECWISVFGIDGMISDKILADRVIEGTIDKEKFIKGNYAIANGLEGDSSQNNSQPTYHVGEKIKIDGKQFEVMAIVEAPYSVTEGKEKEEAAFNLKIFIPSSQFKELFPKNTIRKLFFNVAPEHRMEAEQFIEHNFESKGIPIVSQKTLTEKYNNETKAASMTLNMIVFMILVIGVINLLNSIITSVHVRKKEFAMMQSIGMTKKQLSILLIFEGLDIIGITLLFSYFISFTAISTGVKAYLSTQWTATYQFTIAPLLIITPILILMAAVVPIICFRYMQREEIMDRLHGDAEMSTS